MSEGNALHGNENDEVTLDALRGRLGKVMSDLASMASANEVLREQFADLIGDLRTRMNAAADLIEAGREDEALSVLRSQLAALERAKFLRDPNARQH